jgi:hypothetical protein
MVVMIKNVLKIIFLVASILISVFCGAQTIGSITKTAKNIADAAELISIATDIVETSSFTLDKLETCKNELKDLDKLIKSPQAMKYMSTNNKREWANEIRMVSMNAQLYSTLIASALKRVSAIKTKAIGQNASKVIGTISNAIKGGGDGKAAPVVEAVDQVATGMQQATTEEVLVSVLLKIDEFNRNVDKLVLQTGRLSQTIGSQLGYNIMATMPNRSIYKYAARKNLNVKY